MNTHYKSPPSGDFGGVSRVVPYAVFIAILSLLFSCTKMGPEKVWNNPNDPQGVNWFPPSLVHKSDTSVAIIDTVHLSPEGHDSNGVVIGFLWSFDRGATWLSAILPTVQTHVWGKNETGPHVVYLRSCDNDNLVSPVDSFKVTVHSYVPVIHSVRDTEVSQMASVTIKVAAFDTNSTISKYYWGGQAPGWIDSTEVPQKTFTQPQGGPLFVRWGVIDKDGNVVIDSFRILFNRGPSSVVLSEPAAGSLAPFTSYNFVDMEGRIKIVFSAVDPDGSADTLNYSLYLGESQTSLFLADTGRATSFIAQHITASKVYFWKLIVKDLFGDSTQASGSFTTAAPPGAPSGMKLIRSGSKNFDMGQTGFDSSEAPKHTVSFSYHFWMDSTEVTQKDFATTIGLSSNLASMLPAANCTWFDAALYCNARSKKENKDTVYSYQAVVGTIGNKCTLTGLSINLDAGGYRLPTEAEWEFACRAAAQTLFFWGNDHIDDETYAWLADYSGSQSHAVAGKLPNALGLYDMAGNVWEWCNDWFDAKYYSTSPAFDPIGPLSGQQRSIRGGSFRTTYYFAQSGTRSKIDPATADPSIGFRAVLVNK